VPAIVELALVDPRGALGGGDGPKALANALFPRLARMARDIFSIPAMLAKVERLFSSTKLMIPPARNLLQPDGIKAGECVRSWTLGGLILGDYFEYLSVELREKENFGRQE
jgi:hypothetical protein